MQYMGNIAVFTMSSEVIKFPDYKGSPFDQFLPQCPSFVCTEGGIAGHTYNSDRHIALCACKTSKEYDKDWTNQNKY